ncbi:MAG: flagellar type III secretion system pore protein FliP [Polyangia bacterium]
MNGPTTTQLLSKAVGASNELAVASGGGSSAIKIFLILTALSFGTALVLSVTSFTRVVIVLSFLRQALGTPQLPPNQVLIGLSLFLTLFIMAPTVRRVHEQAFSPLMDDKISMSEALQRAQGPLSDWMLKQTREEDLRLFFEVSASARPARGEAVPFTVLVPAFMVSELGTAFRMGLFLFVPMLLIDLLVAVILMSLGMMMVPPTMVALPLKLGVFLLAGGWHLVVSSLIRSF